MKRLQGLMNFKRAKPEEEYLSTMHEGASEPTLGGEFWSGEGGPENGCTGYNGEVKYGDGSPTLYKGVFDITTVRKEIAYAVKFDPMFYSNLQTRSGSSLLL